MVFEPNESAIAVFRIEVGPLPGEEVSVQIDLQDK